MLVSFHLVQRNNVKVRFKHSSIIHRNASEQFCVFPFINPYTPFNKKHAIVDLNNAHKFHIIQKICSKIRVITKKSH